MSIFYDKYKKYIHCLIMILLTILISSLDPIGSITPYGMQVLGIFVGILYGWIFVDLIWPSIFGFIALGCIGENSIVGMFSSGFGNSALLTVLLTMVFAGALEESGVTVFLSNWFLKKDFFRKTPWFLIIGLLVLSFILGLLQAGLAATFVVWSLIVKISDECHLEKQNHLVSFLLYMVVVVSFTSALIMPFSPGVLMWGAFYPSVLQIPYITFIVYVFILVTLVFVLLFIVGKIIFKINPSDFVLSPNLIEELKQEKSTKKQRLSVIFLALYLLALLLPGFFPSFPGMSFLSKAGVVGVSAVTLLLMSLFSVDGKPLIDLEKTFKNHVQWMLILLLAVTFPLRDALQAENAGIMKFVNSFFTPIISNMGLIGFMIVSTVILGVLTQVTHNVILAAAFMPILCPLCDTIGGNSIVMWFLLFIILQCAYITPAASMQAALVHGHERIIKKDAYILGIAFFIIEIVVLSLVGIPLGFALF